MKVEDSILECKVTFEQSSRREERVRVKALRWESA